MTDTRYKLLLPGRQLMLQSSLDIRLRLDSSSGHSLFSSHSHLPCFPESNPSINLEHLNHCFRLCFCIPNLRQQESCHILPSFVCQTRTSEPVPYNFPHIQITNSVKILVSKKCQRLFPSKIYRGKNLRGKHVR